MLLYQGVEVGENTFIGVNATLRNHIKIGKFNVIGAGALILGDGNNNVFMKNQLNCQECQVIVRNI